MVDGKEETGSDSGFPHNLQMKERGLGRLSMSSSRYNRITIAVSTLYLFVTNHVPCDLKVKLSPNKFFAL